MSFNQRLLSDPSLNVTYRSISQDSLSTQQKKQENSIKRFFDLFSTSLYLENTLAVARDHLGNYWHHQCCIY